MDIRTIKLERVTPVTTTYKAKQYNPIRRRLDDVIIKVAKCGICGNPITPNRDKNWCGYCGYGVNWDIDFEYGKAVKYRYSTSGLKNVRKVNEV